MTLGPGIADAAVVLGSRSTDAMAFATATGSPPLRGVQTLRLPDVDEDAVTLAIDALRRLAQERDLADVGQLLFIGALSDEDAALVTEALDMPSVAVGRHAGTVAAAADALLVAMNGPAEPATVVVAVDDARSTPAAVRGAGAVAVWLSADGHVRLEAEAHRRRHGVDAGLAALLELFTDTADDGSAPIAPAELVPGTAARAFRPYAQRMLASSVGERGPLGAAEGLAALVEGLASPQAEAGCVWLVPTDGGALAARFGGRLAPRHGMKEALGAPVIKSDAPRALGALTAWSGAASAVAQGAHVSRQAYLGEAPARYRWEADVCTTCDDVLFPPREDCPRCGTVPDQTRALSGRGTLFSRTRIAAGGGPTEFDPVQRAVGDYHVGIVALDEGPKVAAMLTGPGADSLSIGDPVHLALRLLYVQDGMRRYGFKAVPA